MGEYHDDLSDRENLLTILDACDTIIGYIEGMNELGFMVDQKTRDACLAQWMVIGERSAKLSDNLIRNHPEVPWKLIVGFKNRGSHSYGTRHFDNSMLWETVSVDTPMIREQVAGILSQMRRD